MSSQTYRMSVEIDASNAKKSIDDLKNGLNDLDGSASKTEQALAELESKTGIVGKTMQTVQSTISKFKSSFSDFASGSKQATQGTNELKQTIEKLGFVIDGGKIKNAKGDIIQYGNSAEEASDDVKKLVNEIGKLGVTLNSKGQLKNAQGDLVKLGDSAEVIANKFNKFKESASTLGLAMAGAFAGVSMGIKGAISESVSLESSMAGLKKVVDFKSPTGLQDMRAEFEKLSTQIPVSTQQLFEMAAAGGQLGVAEDKLKDFTILTAQMATAFDMSADVAGDSMAKLSNVFGKPIDQMAEFGDMINTVSNNMPAKASEIVESLTRVGGVGKTFGLTEKQTVALTSAMISLGKAPEVASTGINSMLNTLSTLDVKNSTVSASLQKMGIDTTKFANRIKTDGYGAIMQLLDGINKLPKDQQIGVVTDLFGKNFGDDIVQLAGAPDVLAKINGLLAEQQNYIGSMKKEAENVSNTTEAKMQMFSNAWMNAKASIGDSFKPALSATMEALTPVLEGITKFAKENPTAVASIIAIAGALTGIAAVAVGIAAILPAVVAGFGLIGAAVGAISLPVIGIVAGIAALIAISVALYKNWDTIKAKAQEVWNGIKQWASDAWQGIVDKWNGFTEWFGGLFDGFSFSGIWDGLLDDAYLIWSGLKAQIQSKWQEIKSSFSGGGDFLSSVWQSIKDGVSSAWESIKAAIKQKWEEIKQGFKEWLTGQPVQVQEMIDNILSIFDGLAAGIGLVWDLISAGASLAWDGIKTIVGGAVDWISGTWDKIKDGASGAWESIKDTASSTWETVKSSAGTAWSSVKNNVQNNLEQAKTIVGNVATEVGNAWDKAKDGAGRAFDKVKGVIGEKLGGAKNEASQAMQGVSDAIANSGVADAFAKAFNAIKSTVASVIQAVQTLFVSGVNAWRIVLQAGLSAFATLFNTAFNTVKTVVQTAFAVIKGVVTGDMNAVKSAFQNGLSQLASIARTAITQMVGVFKSAGSQLVGVGGDIVQGLINGLKAKMAQAIAVARDMASQVVSIIKSIFRTASPSRVTRQIGEWVSEGLAIGIAYKAPVAAEKAKEMAKQVLDNIKSEKEKLSRDIFLAHQKIAGNPFAEFTADIKFGKYDGVDKKELAELQLLQAKNYAMQQAVKFVDERNQLEQQIAEIGLDELALYERKLALYDAVEEASLNELRALNQQKIAKQNTFNLEQKIADINEKILLVGKSELEILAYQLDHAKEYQGVSNEIKQSYLERTKALQDENKELERKKKLENAKEGFERSKRLFANRHDPQAALRYDLAKEGMKPEQIDEMARYAQAEEQFKKLNELADKLKQGTVFGKASMQTQITDYKTGFAFAGEYAQQSNQLETTYQQELALLQKALEEKRITQEQHNADMLLLDEQYLAKKKTLNDTAQASIMSGLTNIAKMYYGENKTQYKRMFQLEKAYAIASALMANKTALAKAWASAPFPANLGAVAKVALESSAIVSAISGIRPIGQAHDGIMSVPKSGTWNLEKGERVLPKHTAKAMDAKLDSLGNGGNQINITVNVDNNGNSQTTGDSHKEAKSLADSIKAVVLQTLTKERKQGGLLYG